MKSAISVTMPAIIRISTRTQVDVCVGVSLLLQSAQTAVRRQAMARSQTALTALLPIPETMLRSIRILRKIPVRSIL